MPSTAVVHAYNRHAPYSVLPYTCQPGSLPQHNVLTVQHLLAGLYHCSRYKRTTSLQPHHERKPGEPRQGSIEAGYALFTCSQSYPRCAGGRPSSLSQTPYIIRTHVVLQMRPHNGRSQRKGIRWSRPQVTGKELTGCGYWSATSCELLKLRRTRSTCDDNMYERYSAPPPGQPCIKWWHQSTRRAKIIMLHNCSRYPCSSMRQQVSGKSPKPAI